LLIELTDEEFGEFERANNALAKFVRGTELFIVVLDNYQAYYNTLYEILQAFIARRESDFVPGRAYMAINRQLLNWLSSVRTYLDHMELSIKRCHGENSAIWRNFRAACSEAYDGNFSYRFIYRLRNYAQHSGLPAHTVQFNTAPSPTDPSRPEHEMFVACHRDNLLEEFDGWGAPLREELARQLLEIELRPHVDTMMTLLEQINMTYIRGVSALLRPEAQYVYDLLHRLPESAGERCVFDVDFRTDEVGKITDIATISVKRTYLDIAHAIFEDRIQDVIGSVEIQTI
jgi:hypothetical protein